MWYILEGQYGTDIASKREAARPAHLKRLQDLQDAGRLLMAGPVPAIDSEEPGPAGFLGSLIVASFASKADAQAWLDIDPYMLEGVYAATMIRPFKKVIPF